MPLIDEIFKGLKADEMREQRKADEALARADEASDDKASDDEASDDKASDDKASDDKASDDKASDDKASDDKASDDEASDDEASDDKASDDKASDDEASDDEASDDEASEQEMGGEQSRPLVFESEFDRLLREAKESWASFTEINPPPKEPQQKQWVFIAIVLVLGLLRRNYAKKDRLEGEKPEDIPKPSDELIESIEKAGQLKLPDISLSPRVVLKTLLSSNEPQGSVRPLFRTYQDLANRHLVALLNIILDAGIKDMLWLGEDSLLAKLWHRKYYTFSTKARRLEEMPEFTSVQGFEDIVNALQLSVMHAAHNLAADLRAGECNCWTFALDRAANQAKAQEKCESKHRIDAYVAGELSFCQFLQRAVWGGDKLKPEGAKSGMFWRRAVGKEGRVYDLHTYFLPPSSIAQFFCNLHAPSFFECCDKSWVQLAESRLIIKSHWHCNQCGFAQSEIGVEEEKKENQPVFSIILNLPHLTREERDEIQVSMADDTGRFNVDSDDAVDGLRTIIVPLPLPVEGTVETNFDGDVLRIICPIPDLKKVVSWKEPQFTIAGPFCDLKCPFCSEHNSGKSAPMTQFESYYKECRIWPCATNEAKRREKAHAKPTALSVTAKSQKMAVAPPLTGEEKQRLVALENQDHYFQGPYGRICPFPGCGEKHGQRRVRAWKQVRKPSFRRKQDEDGKKLGNDFPTIREDQPDEKTVANDYGKYLVDFVSALRDFAAMPDENRCWTRWLRAFAERYPGVTAVEDRGSERAETMGQAIRPPFTRWKKRNGEKSPVSVEEWEAILGQALRPLFTWWKKRNGEKSPVSVEEWEATLGIIQDYIEWNGKEIDDPVLDDAKAFAAAMDGPVGNRLETFLRRHFQKR
jgi:hypothetical protein